MKQHVAPNSSFLLVIKMYKASYNGVEWKALKGGSKAYATSISYSRRCALSRRRAQARIGETEDQVKARYGEAIRGPSQPGIGVTKFYSSNSFLVSVTFLNGRAPAK